MVQSFTCLFSYSGSSNRYERVRIYFSGCQLNIPPIIFLPQVILKHFTLQVILKIDCASYQQYYCKADYDTLLYTTTHSRRPSRYPVGQRRGGYQYFSFCSNTAGYHSLSYCSITPAIRMFHNIQNMQCVAIKRMQVVIHYCD